MAQLSSLKTDALTFLLKAARWRLFKPLASFLLGHMNTFLPVTRLSDNDHWTAFHHPQPDYRLHILILPKKPLSSLEEAQSQPVEFHQDFFKIVHELITEFDLKTCGYRLINNGGSNQLVPHWHWHLISDLTQETHG